MGTWSPHNETDPYLINTSNSLMGLIHLQEYKEVPFVTRSQWSYSRGQALFSVLSSAHTPLQSQCALSGQNRKSLSRTDFYYSRCAEHYLLDWEERVFKSTQIISLSADIPSFSFNYSIYIFTFATLQAEHWLFCYHLRKFADSYLIYLVDRLPALRNSIDKGGGGGWGEVLPGLPDKLRHCYNTRHPQPSH